MLSIFILLLKSILLLVFTYSALALVISFFIFIVYRFYIVLRFFLYQFYISLPILLGFFFIFYIFYSDTNLFSIVFSLFINLFYFLILFYLSSFILSIFFVVNSCVFFLYFFFFSSFNFFNYNLFYICSYFSFNVFYFLNYFFNTSTYQFLSNLILDSYNSLVLHFKTFYPNLTLKEFFLCLFDNIEYLIKPFKMLGLDLIINFDSFNKLFLKFFPIHKSFGLPNDLFDVQKIPYLIDENNPDITLSKFLIHLFSGFDIYQLILTLIIISINLIYVGWILHTFFGTSKLDSRPFYRKRYDTLFLNSHNYSYENKTTIFTIDSDEMMLKNMLDFNSAQYYFYFYQRFNYFIKDKVNKSSFVRNKILFENSHYDRSSLLSPSLPRFSISDYKSGPGSGDVFNYSHFHYKDPRWSVFDPSPGFTYNFTGSDLIWRFADVYWPSHWSDPYKINYYYWLGYEFSAIPPFFNQFAPIQTHFIMDETTIDSSNSAKTDKIRDFGLTWHRERDLYFPMSFLCRPVSEASKYNFVETFNFKPALVSFDPFFYGPFISNKTFAQSFYDYMLSYCLNDRRLNWIQSFSNKKNYSWVIWDYLRLILNAYSVSRLNTDQFVDFSKIDFLSKSFFENIQINQSYLNPEVPDIELVASKNSNFIGDFKQLYRKLYCLTSNIRYGREHEKFYWVYNYTYTINNFFCRLSRDSCNFLGKDSLGVIFNFENSLFDHGTSLHNFISDYSNLEHVDTFVDRFFGLTSLELFANYFIYTSNWFFCDDARSLVKDQMKYSLKLQNLNKNFSKNFYLNDYSVDFTSIECSDLFLIKKYYKNIFSIYKSSYPILNYKFFDDFRFSSFQEIFFSYRNLLKRGYVYFTGSPRRSHAGILRTFRFGENLKESDMFSFFFAPLIEDLQVQASKPNFLTDKYPDSTIFSTFTNWRTESLDRYKPNPQYFYEYYVSRVGQTPEDSHNAHYSLDTGPTSYSMKWGRVKPNRFLDLDMSIMNGLSFPSRFAGNTFSYYFLFVPVVLYFFIGLDLNFDLVVIGLFVYLLFFYFLNGTHYYWWKPTFSKQDQITPGFSGWIKVDSSTRLDEYLSDAGFDENMYIYVDSSLYKRHAGSLSYYQHHYRNRFTLNPSMDSYLTFGKRVDYSAYDNEFELYNSLLSKNTIMKRQQVVRLNPVTFDINDSLRSSLGTFHNFRNFPMVPDGVYDNDQGLLIASFKYLKSLGIPITKAISTGKYSKISQINPITTIPGTYFNHRKFEFSSSEDGDKVTRYYRLNLLNTFSEPHKGFDSEPGQYNDIGVRNNLIPSFEERLNSNRSDSVLPYGPYDDIVEHKRRYFLHTNDNWKYLFISYLVWLKRYYTQVFLYLFIRLLPIFLMIGAVIYLVYKFFFLS